MPYVKSKSAASRGRTRDGNQTVLTDLTVPCILGARQSWKPLTIVCQLKIDTLQKLVPLRAPSLRKQGSSCKYWTKWLHTTHSGCVCHSEQQRSLDHMWPDPAISDPAISDPAILSHPTSVLGTPVRLSQAFETYALVHSNLRCAGHDMCLCTCMQLPNVCFHVQQRSCVRNDDPLKSHARSRV